MIVESFLISFLFYKNSVVALNSMLLQLLVLFRLQKIRVCARIVSTGSNGQQTMTQANKQKKELNFLPFQMGFFSEFSFVRSNCPSSLREQRTTWHPNKRKNKISHTSIHLWEHVCGAGVDSIHVLSREMRAYSTGRSGTRHQRKSDLY